MAGRDMKIPFTEEELDEFVTGFKSLSSYQPGENGGTVPAEELPELARIARIGIDRASKEQIEVYKDYFTTNFEGRIELDPLVKNLRKAHKTESLFRSMIKDLDKDGDGYISEKEFHNLLGAIVVYDRTLQGFQITFEEFVKEADTSKDGKVNLEECCKWLENRIKP